MVDGISSIIFLRKPSQLFIHTWATKLYFSMIIAGQQFLWILSCLIWEKLRKCYQPQELKFASR